MITMFNMMTTEGWIGVMWNGVDATDIHQQPVRGNQPIAVLFFIVFLIFGALFILNAFVGVVISKFNEEKAKLSRDHLMTELQHQYTDIMIKGYGCEPKKKFTRETGDPCSNMIWQLASSPKFDGFILLCILLNTVCLGLSWYR